MGLLVKAKFSCRDYNDDSDTYIDKPEPMELLIEVTSPRITAKNWYEANSGRTLEDVIYARGAYSILRQYDTITYKRDGIEQERRVFATRQSNDSQYVTIIEAGL